MTKPKNRPEKVQIGKRLPGSQPVLKGKSSAPGVKAAAGAPAHGRYDVMDKSKPFDRISPPAIGKDGQAVVYGQMCRDGIKRYYNHEGQRVITPWDDLAKEAARAAKQAAPRPPVEDEVSDEAKHIIDATEGQADETAEDDDEDEDDTGDGVNLTAYAIEPGVKYPFAAVRNAIKERFNKVCVTEKEALELLINEGIATLAQIEAKWTV
jgi:hypothetical protein